MLGADTDALRALDQRAQALGVLVRHLGDAVRAEAESVAWSGHDAERFRAKAEEIPHATLCLSQRLSRLGALLASQAAAQDIASSSREGRKAAGESPGGDGFSKAAPELPLGPGVQAGLGGAGGDEPAEGETTSADYPGLFPDAKPLAELRPRREAEPVLDSLLALDDPAEVARAWDELAASDPAMAETLVALFHEEVGNLEGVPYSVRDTANRLTLRDYLDSRMHASGDEYLAAVAIADELAAGRAHPTQLVTLEPIHDNAPGPLAAAISYGDLDTASNATFLVPGMRSDAGADVLTSQGDAASNLLERLDMSGQIAEDSAVVSWVGYDTPELAEEPFLDRANHGALRLGEALEGYSGRNAPSEHTLNVVAFSYGTTTTGQALFTGGDTYGVDNVVLLGSAGLSDEAKGFRDDAADAPDVFVTDAARDELNNVGQAWWTGSQHQHDPRSYPWATSFGSDGVEGDPTRLGVEDHTLGRPDAVGYLSKDSESLAFVVQALTDGV